MPNGQRGFTLIELLVTIAIVAILSAVGFTVYSNAQISSRDNIRKQDIKRFNTAFELFYERYGFYPSYDTSSQGDSTSTNWDSLFQYVFVSGSAVVDSTIKTSDFISQTPVDPVNNSTYHYNYYVQSAGQGYRVCTSLENTNDPDYNATAWGTDQNYCENNP